MTDARTADATLTWPEILRLGLVQTSLGAIIVLMTSTINRVMIVEVGLPAFVPGLLVAAHYLVQISRPAWGYGSDVGGRRTPWIIGGMAFLAAGGVGAAVATAIMSVHPVLGLVLAAASFLALGLGAGAAGTSVLALLATRTAPERRPAAATTVWIMMILGFAVTAPLAGHFLEPFSFGRLVEVTTVVALAALCLATLAIQGLEGAAAKNPAGVASVPRPHDGQFWKTLSGIWRDPAARRFTLFIFVSMLAYSAQELILDPFAGVVFGLSPAASTKLAGVQHGGVLLGMLAVGSTARFLRGTGWAAPRRWTVAGCLASAAAVATLSLGGLVGPTFPLRATVFALGVANGVFAVSAIGTMMELAGAGGGTQAGTRMGLWGAAQALAFAGGGFIGTLSVDVARHVFAHPAMAYAIVFAGEGLLFLLSANLAARLAQRPPPERAVVAGRGEPAAAIL